MEYCNEYYYYSKKMIPTIDSKPIIICSICEENETCNCNNNKETEVKTTTTTTFTDDFFKFKDVKKEKKKVTFIEDIEVPMYMPQPPAQPLAAAAAKHHVVVAHHHHVVVGTVGAVCY